MPIAEVLYGLRGVLVRVFTMAMRRVFGISTADVYQGQAELERIRPIQKAVARQPVDACWLTGIAILRTLQAGEHQLRRLILPNPDAADLDSLGETTGQPYTLREDIRMATQIAMAIGIEVRWYPGVVGTALTLGKKWVHVEPILPHGTVGKRPIMRIAGWGTGEVRARYRRTFEQLWEASKDPTP